MDTNELLRKWAEMDEDWIYRFRSFSALSLKELMYDEIYFASPDELNDPLNLGAELVIGEGCYFVYEFFISGAFCILDIPKPPDDLSKEIQDFIKNVSYQYSRKANNVRFLLSEENKFWLYDQFGISGLKTDNFENFFRFLSNGVLNILPDRLLSVSFSKDLENPLLWSIYGDKHQGFCVIYSPDNKKLRIRNSLEENYEDYEIKKVDYKSDINVDLSLMFNESKEFDYDCMFKEYIPELEKKALLTKNSNWLKEKEFRIFKRPNFCFSQLSSEPKNPTSIEKTHYTDTSQIAGVIFGYRMKSDKRNEIIRILENKKWSTKFFEAVPDGNSIRIRFLKFLPYFNAPFKAKT